jgi:multiple sugar transport system permease protein
MTAVPVARAHPRRRRRTARSRLVDVALNAATLLVVLVAVLPFLWMVFSSVQTNGRLLTGQLTFTNLDWGNYAEIFEQIEFGKYLRNSMVICVTTTVLATSLSCGAGYALARFRFRGSGAYGLTVIGTQLIPGVAFLLPIYMLFVWTKAMTGFPLIDTFWGMIGVYTAFFTPVGTWLMRAFFLGVPAELEEAAAVDGCGPLGAFVRVVLPSATPGILATAMYVFLAAWDELLFAAVLTQTADVATIPVGIRLFVGQFQNRFDLLMAAGVVSTIPVMVAFYAAQRYLVKGLTAGAVKG